MWAHTASGRNRAGPGQLTHGDVHPRGPFLFFCCGPIQPSGVGGWGASHGTTSGGRVAPTRIARRSWCGCVRGPALGVWACRLSMQAHELVWFGPGASFVPGPPIPRAGGRGGAPREPVRRARHADPNSAGQLVRPGVRACAGGASLPLLRVHGLLGFALGCVHPRERLASGNGSPPRPSCPDGGAHPMEPLRGVGSTGCNGTPKCVLPPLRLRWRGAS